MRAKNLVVCGLALLLGACSGGNNHAPPPLNKQLLTGKWRSESDIQLIEGYDFADDGTVKVAIQGMKEPVSAHYAWSGERMLDLEYPEAADVRKAYSKAAKAYKDGLAARVKSGDLPDKALGPMSGAVPDELPPKETLQVSLSEKPRLLMLTNPSGTSQKFNGAN
jgi:hypothetical protein